MKSENFSVEERERGTGSDRWFCQEETLVLIEQFSSMECDAFHVSYLSDKTPEAVFNGQVTV